MASISRLKAGSSAEEVECLDELLTNILSRVPTRDLFKMSTVRKRWRALISDPGFVHTHYRNCQKEPIFCFTDIEERPTPEQYQFFSYNFQTGNLFTVPFSWEGLDRSFKNGRFELLTASNGLMCFYSDVPGPVLWVYNPVTKFLKKLLMPFLVNVEMVFFVEICYTQNTLKFAMAGLSLVDENPYIPYTLVFDSHLNSWYTPQPLPLLRFIDIEEYDSVATQLFYNGVIYLVVRVESREAEELEQFRDVDDLYRDCNNLLHMIIGYDVNHGQWGFYLFVPASVGFVFRLIEWEGNLLACASNTWNGWDGGDGHFPFWTVDTEHKLWIRERELDLSHERHFYWRVYASSGIVWFTCGDDSVIVYHMKNRHWSRHRLDDDAYDITLYVTFGTLTFEPTLLSF